MHVHTSICISVCLLALPLISLTCFATVPDDEVTLPPTTSLATATTQQAQETTTGTTQEVSTTTSSTTTTTTTTSTSTSTTTSTTTTACATPSTCADPAFTFIVDSCFVSTHIRMNDQCRLQYSETNGPYVTYDGSLAACQRVNQASHLWYPTGQAQRDAVIAMYQGDYYNGVREDPPGSDMWTYGVGGPPITWTDWNPGQPSPGPGDDPTMPAEICCPCIANAQTGCLQYDSRYQATTLEEAMASFPDLTQDQDTSNPTTLEDDAKCETQECLDCQRDLRKKLAEVGLLPAAIDQAIAAQGNYTTCRKYSFSKDEDDDDDDGNNHFNISINYTFILDDSNEVDDGKKKKRYRRQIPPVQTTTNSATLGTIYTLSCTKKGAVVDAKGYVSLCSSCWVWRKLPDNYSPQYINELVCDNADGSCLSGYASCSLGERTLEVSRNDNGMMTKVALAAGSYCECYFAANFIGRRKWIGGIDASDTVKSSRLTKIPT